MRAKPAIQWSLRGLIALAIIGLTVLTIYFLSTKTTIDGSVEAPGLASPVTIKFDSAGIPHIAANTDQDAWYAIGYLHATERAWQMEFNRRLASGKLAEILGPETLGLDKFMRTLGIKRMAEKQYENLPIEAKRELQAYADGVNEGLRHMGWALPPELLLTRSKPGVWSPTDSVAWSLMMALDLGDNWHKEFMRLELSSHMETSRIWEVLPPYPGESPGTSVNFAHMYREAGIFRKPDTPTARILEHRSLYAQLPGTAEGIGSNNWVVAGEKSASGKPWLANDPHLSLTAPAVWYVAHIQSPGINVIGATLPGMPAVILGRNDSLAWGFTNTGPDVQDLFIEAIDPSHAGRYKTPDGSANFILREEIIAVKGRNPERIIVRESRHGPVISDHYPRAQDLIDTSRFALALGWTALDPHNQTILSSLEMNKAQNIDAFKDALRHYHAPMQNIVIADTSGHISYRAIGAVPKRSRNQGLFGVAPAFGWERQHDWSGYLPLAALPKDDNPSKGWIATANQRVQAANDPNPLTGDWLLPYRYNRIEEWLSKSNHHDLQSMKDLQGDVVSLSALELLPFLEISPSNHPLAEQAKRLMNGFDGKMNANSAPAAILNAWALHLTNRLFADKLKQTYTIEQGKREFRAGLHKVLSLYTNGKGEADFWCDKASTPTPETCAEAMGEALTLALDDLSKRLGNNPVNWRWGDLHVAVSEHRPMSQVAWLKKRFEVRREIGGDGFTVNVGSMTAGDSSNPYLANKAASLRTIYDLSDLNKSLFIYQTGQSGWVNSRQYENFATPWANMTYLPLSMNPNQITHTATLEPVARKSSNKVDQKPNNSAPARK